MEFDVYWIWQPYQCSTTCISTYHTCPTSSRDPLRLPMVEHGAVVQSQAFTPLILSYVLQYWPGDEATHTDMQPCTSLPSVANLVKVCSFQVHTRRLTTPQGSLIFRNDPFLTWKWVRMNLSTLNIAKKKQEACWVRWGHAQWHSTEDWIGSSCVCVCKCMIMHRWKCGQPHVGTHWSTVKTTADHKRPPQSSEGLNHWTRVKVRETACSTCMHGDSYHQI